MLATARAPSPSFARPTRIISAHADYRRSDFMFSRIQSRDMRATPWARRIRPMRSWSEIAGYSTALLIGTILVSAFV